MNKTILGIIMGLLLSVSIVYFIEAIEELGESEYAEGVFFLITGIAHIIMVFLLWRNNKKLYHYILIAGTISLIVLYVVTRSDLSSIGELGIVSKTIQIGIIISSCIILFKKI